ncbi:hypothetical protein D9753_25715 [Streptomyces dangxiongensis]|uniref:Uncharacterized protein n=1 Tax=Streptomyces dangxiongensis TaxID=1442032 RepID=A0A3G2JMB6_9ACTN|nr:hypothetical protein D9753_25715 [Streptomyces dangxiongensis]
MSTARQALPAGRSAAQSLLSARLQGGLVNTTEESSEVVLVDDVEALAEGTTPGCGDDNPYQ